MNDRTRSDELRPCPFCGHAPTLMESTLLQGQWFMVLCDANECRVNPSIDWMSKEHAVALWNRRQYSETNHDE